jgi:hypothetical protein
MQCVALSPTSSHWGSAQKAKHASADTAKMAYARTPGETGTLVAPRCTAYAAPIPAPTPCIAIAKDATASTITILAILLALSPTQKDSSQANPAAGHAWLLSFWAPDIASGMARIVMVLAVASVGMAMQECINCWQSSAPH